MSQHVPTSDQLFLSIVEGNSLAGRIRLPNRRIGRIDCYADLIIACHWHKYGNFTFYGILIVTGQKTEVLLGEQHLSIRELDCIDTMIFDGVRYRVLVEDDKLIVTQWCDDDALPFIQEAEYCLSDSTSYDTQEMVNGWNDILVAFGEPTIDTIVGEPTIDDDDVASIAELYRVVKASKLSDAFFPTLSDDLEGLTIRSV